MKLLELRVRALLCSVFILGILSFAPANAQNFDQCLPDCQNDNFTLMGMLPPILLAVPGQPGCSLEVNYGYRNACGLWNDFFIYSIQAIGTCSQSFLTDPNAIMQTATTLLLMSNPPIDMMMNKVGPTKPSCGNVNCVTNWRVSKGSCWKAYGGGLFGPCETSGCCLQPFQICRDFCDNITVQNLAPATGGGCLVAEIGCVTVCQ
ncbi:MAG TPA: hypothetical protein ENJ82_15055 [Bacteroidetes bacterium]|nr:hypothetical protein [Bacteroidota bacterium]